MTLNEPLAPENWFFNLTRMAYELESAVATAKEAGVSIPDNLDVTFISWGTGKLETPSEGYREEWRTGWRKAFGEELPTVYELIKQAKESVAAAIKTNQ